MAATFRPTDPLYSSQWHFGLIGQLGYSTTTAGNTEGIERIWADYRGASVNVGIWDDGVFSSHWDLQANIDPSLLVTVAGTLNNGEPVSPVNGHGTAVAGLIAAADNGRGGVGVAPDARITSVRVFGGPDDINSAWSRYLLTLDSLGNFDVTNHSYGSTPDFQVYGDVAKFQAAAASGRGGLGTVSVFAAGNSNIDGNGEAINASRFSVTVGALLSAGQLAGYSNYGAHLLVSAPAGAITTDLVGQGTGYDGLENGDYTNRFGGTSAASPITAGVITLMLDANPTLGWRDVQNILAYSSVGIGSLYGGSNANENFGWKWNGADNWNGGGLHYSEDYGYGMVNAFNAVRMAEAWKYFTPAPATSANELVAATGTLNAGSLAISDLSTTSYSFSVGDNIDLEHVALTLSLTHSNFRDLRIRLVAPNGTAMSLYDGSSGSASSATGLFTYSFGVDGFRGLDSAGTWRVDLQDAIAGNAGTLFNVAFSGYGSTISTDDVYHYTDEVFTVISQPGLGSRINLSDTDGGSDWIDASAMVRDLNLNLNDGSTSSAGGTAFLSIASGTRIEKATGGDGNDRLIGNDFDNVLLGMRGDDRIDGKGGIDTAVFRGLSGLYTINSSSGRTTVVGTDGTDVLTGIEFLRFDDATINDPSGGIEPPPEDGTVPVLVSLTPVDGATAVQPSANLILGFSESMKAGLGDVVIRYAIGTEWRRIAITDTTQVAITGSSVTINPSIDLPGSSSFYVTIDDGALLDISGTAFAGISDPATFNFTTADITPPALFSFTPADNSTAVPVASNLVFTFNEAVQAGSGSVVIRYAIGTELRRISITDTSQVSFSGNTVTVNPSVDLPGTSSLYVTVEAGAIRDLAGNAFAGISDSSTFNFVTGDATPPTLVSLTPADNAVGVAVGSNLVLGFNEAVQAGIGSVVIRNADGSEWRRITITDNSQISFSGSSVTINPSVDLPDSSAFFVTVEAGAILDSSGNAFAGISDPAIFNFTTADATPPALLTLTPADDATGIAGGANLALGFSEAVRAGSGNVVIRNVDGSEWRRMAITDTSQISFSGNSVIINPSVDLPGSSAFYVTVEAGAILDATGNGFAGISDPATFNFTTAEVFNTITGTSKGETLTGTALSDRIFGLGGNDTLVGGAGNDLLDGGDGTDTASFAGITGNLLLNLALTGAQSSGGAGVDSFVSIENLIAGSGNDTLLGDAGANRLDGANGNDWIEGGAGNDTLLGNGNGSAGDTVSYASALSSVTVSLAVTSGQNTGGAGTDAISGFENLLGSGFDDTLTGGNGSNRIDAGNGNDRIRGTGGRDTVTGGAGSDVFIYGANSEAGVGATGRDVITDLQPGDRIDLSLLDADTKTSGKQTFTFIGTAAFTAAGQIRYDVGAGLVVLQANTANATGAEFELELLGLTVLDSSSLII